MEGGLSTLHRIAPGSPRVSDVPRIRAMGRLVKQWDSVAPAWVPPSYDAQTRKALEALGYLDGADAHGTPDANAASPAASPR